MIKQVLFSRTNSMDAKPLVLDFSRNINVIIGPKGGGKSTLFDLLAGLKDNYISQSVIDAFEAYGLKFEKAIKFNNEQILASQLPKKKLKEKMDNYANRCDVISQDDPIKKDLTSADEIEWEKFEYIKTKVYISKNVAEYIAKIKQFYNAMNSLNDLNIENSINWSNTFKMDELDSNKNDLKVITNLDYRPTAIVEAVRQEDYYAFVETGEQFLNVIDTVARTAEEKTIYRDTKFTNTVKKMVEDLGDLTGRLFNVLRKRAITLEKIKTTAEAFSKSYRFILDKIKNENYSSSGLSSYETAAKNYFRNFAQSINNAAKLYSTIIGEDTFLTVENDPKQTGNFKFEINKNVKLSDELKFEILKIVLPSPGNVQQDIFKWLKALASKGIKFFDEEKIKNAIARALKPETKIYIDFGDQLRDYDSLSLGQKSIYGLKYKFNRSLQENLFLDQPEDNLDNNTITSEILPLFDLKKDNQVFIVTHNANIGILSNPSQVIVANLSDKKNLYRISNVAEVINDESANYLEGGKEFLKKRYNKIIKNNKEK